MMGDLLERLNPVEQSGWAGAVHGNPRRFDAKLIGLRVGIGIEQLEGDFAVARRHASGHLKRVHKTLGSAFDTRIDGSNQPERQRVRHDELARQGCRVSRRGK